MHYGDLEKSAPDTAEHRNTLLQETLQRLTKKDPPVDIDRVLFQLRDAKLEHMDAQFSARQIAAWRTDSHKRQRTVGRAVRELQSLLAWYTSGDLGMPGRHTLYGTIGDPDEVVSAVSRAIRVLKTDELLNAPARWPLRRSRRGKPKTVTGECHAALERLGVSRELRKDLMRASGILPDTDGLKLDQRK